MEFQDLTNTEEFKHLHPLKKQIIEELYHSTQNTPFEMLIPKVLHTNKELQKRKLAFTKEESQILIQILTQNLNPEERKKIDTILSILS